MRRVIAATTAALSIVALTMTSAHATTPTFGAPVRMPVGTGTEPGVHVGGDGTVYVDAPQGVGTHSRLWRSLGGTSPYQAMDFQTPYGRFPGGGDSEVVLGRGASKRVYFLDLWAGSNSLERSEDQGQTWTAGTPITTLPLSDRQWMALGPQDASGNDTVYIVYALIQPPKQVMIARSTDSGATWTFHNPAGPIDGAAGYTSQVVADTNGFVAFAWRGTNTLSASYSNDEGTTWGTTQIADHVDTAAIPGFAMDPTNSKKLYAAWIDSRDYSVKEASSSDGGVTWGAPVQLSAPGGSNMFVWITASAGKVAAAWYSTPDGPADPNGFTATTAWNLGYAEDTGTGFTTTPVTSAGIVKHGAICTQGVLCTSGRELGDFLNVTLDNADHAVISFVDTANAAVKVVTEQ